MASYPNPWTFNGKEFDDNDAVGHIGFVYLIEGPTKKYVGKKILWFAKRRILKGKRPKLYKAPSDWKTYYGSSDELNEDVQSLGQDKFRREILRMCKTKTEMSYYELREQMDRRVLENDEYYNKWVSAKIRHRMNK